MSDPIASLLDHLDAVRAFVRQRVADEELAEDVMQESLLKALRAGGELRDEERLLPWFYRILRNGIVDAYRRTGAEDRRLEAIRAGFEDSLLEETEVANRLCACMDALIPALKPEYAELIRELDLGEASTADLADRLGITRNNLKVRHHRARTQLRKRLEETCRVCAAHGCLDCTCAEERGSR